MKDYITPSKRLEGYKREYDYLFILLVAFLVVGCLFCIYL